MAEDHPLLEVRQLAVEFSGPGAPNTSPRPVEDVSFDVQVGQALGIVGESGCGKTLTALSILGLVPPPGRVVRGTIRFLGEDLRAASSGRLRQLRGDRIAMVFQEPMSALNPTMRVGDQVAEAFRVHRRVGRPAGKERALQLFGQVGIPDPRRCLGLYPHQMSGGMQQRVLLAMALCCDPELLVADEPTTALDVTVQAGLMRLLLRARTERSMGLVLVSHDLALVAGACETMVVLYAGRVVEQGPVRDCLQRPAHPYTAALLGAVDSLERHRQRLDEIPGAPPDLMSRGPGCAFAPRCVRAAADCRERMPALEVAAQDVTARGVGEPLWNVECSTPVGVRSVRCHHPLSGEE